jgi:hypothetical protein
MILLAFVAVVTGLAPPVLPNSFVATFTNPPDPAVPDVGTWYYDWTTGLQRIDGGNQETCNRVSGAPLFCSTYLSATGLLVAFPFQQRCCRESSPGLLRPDWLAHDNATFQGTQRVGSRVCDVWLAMGSSRNYWLQERASGFPCLLDDGGYNFTFISFQAVPIAAAVVTPPSYCANAPSC